MNASRLKYEGWLYGLAFLIALGFRLIGLGATPLTDTEASLAMQALHISQGADPLLGPQPAYIMLTSILFGLLNTTNFIARFLPAIAGSVLVLAPYLFRDRLKPAAALILAFLIAIDPGMVALSRLAGGTMLAVTFLLFAWGTWSHRRLIPAGIFAGLTLLSGTSFWAGLVTFALTWLFLQGLEARSQKDPSQAPTGLPVTKYELHPALLALVITVVLVGSLFFTAPNGLSAWVASLPEYLKGWISASVMTQGRMLFTVIVYEALGVYLAVLALIRGYRNKSKPAIRLSVWLGVSLLLAVFYRQPGELVWAIIPLLALAALELSRSLNIFSSERLEVGVVGGALLILLTYIWFDIAAIGLDPFSQFATSIPMLGSVQNPRYVVLYGAIAILIACITFVAIGWSARTAWLGSTWALIIFLIVYSLGAAWGGSGLRFKNSVELWTPDQKPVEADLLLSSVDEISGLSLGHDLSQPVTVMGVHSPALEWLLHDHEVKLVSSLDPQDAPPILITPASNDISLPSAYRGQDFIWRQRVQYESMQRPEWWRWLVNRQLPRENELIILWVRNDLFPDAR